MVDNITTPMRKAMIVEEIPSNVFHIPHKEKREMMNIPVPQGHVRCVVIMAHEGMLCWHDAGDIIDLPERRFKTLTLRGLVKEYKGVKEPGDR